MAESTVAWAVSKTTMVDGAVRCAYSKTCSPLMPGILISRTIRSNSVAASLSNASCPLAAMVTLAPRSEKISDSDKRVVRSSSTIRRCAPWSILYLLFFSSRNLDDEGCPLAYSTLYINRSAAAFDNGIADRQAQPGAIRLGGVEGFKDVRLEFSGDARSTVSETGFDGVVSHA